MWNRIHFRQEQQGLGKKIAHEDKLERLESKRKGKEKMQSIIMSE